jgi:hypothetical protein
VSAPVPISHQVKTKIPDNDGNRTTQPLFLGTSNRMRGDSPAPPVPARSRFRTRRYIARAILNTLGPAAVTGFYVFIVVEYLWRPSVNNIIPWRPFDAKAVFFAWLILSIFLLDWARSGIAGFEAAVLMKPTLALTRADQLMWHSDRAWGSLSGWWKALVCTFRYLGKRMSRRRGSSLVEWDGPRPLWYYLALSSILFYAAVPLSALSLDPKDSLWHSNRVITIFGTNQSTFDIRPSNSLAEQADGRWRQGNPTTPHGATIFYAPEGISNATTTFYEDAIQSIYASHLQNPANPPNQTVAFFSGPEVSERTYGSVWGALSNVSCVPVNPYKGLKLLNVTSINNWTSGSLGVSSSSYGKNQSAVLEAQFESGLTPVFFNIGQMFGVSYQYVMASDRDIQAPFPEYTNNTLLPILGAAELVMWQSYQLKDGNLPDQTFTNMSRHPLVVSSISPIDNLTYLGFGVRCAVSSTVGTAKLSAQDNTFSNFVQEPATQSEATIGPMAITLYPAVMAMQSLVFSAFTTVTLTYLGRPKCDSQIVTCDGWVGANKATNGVPIFVPKQPSPPGMENSFVGGNIQYPTISPERMTLALYKLFGEVSVALMAAGPGNWTSTPNTTSSLGLFGLDHANDIVPGRVSYKVPLSLLVVWTLITILPQLVPSFLFSQRTAPILDGFEMFRLGAAWTANINDMKSTPI